MATAIGTALTPVEVMIRVRLNPRKQSVINLLQQNNVLLIILLHYLPRSRIFVHALDPQLIAFV
jgi:hypothetical protein